MAQVQCPPFDVEKLEDHISFVVARHAVTSSKKVVGSTQAAFDFLGSVEHSTEKIQEWLKCFEVC